MTEISKLNSYSIDDLITFWRAGWGKLADVMHSMNITYETSFSDTPKGNSYDKITKPEINFIISGLSEVSTEMTHLCGKIGSFHNMWIFSIIWAVFRKLKKIESKNCKKNYKCDFNDFGGSKCFFMGCFRESIFQSIDEKEQLEVYKIFIEKLIKSKNIKSAFIDLSLSKDYDSVIEYWSHKKVKYESSFEEFINWEIPFSCIKILEWLLKAANAPELIPEAFFSSVWISIKSSARV